MGHHHYTSGITHLAVGGYILEFHRALVLARLPDLVLEAVRAAVQMVGAVVDRQLVSYTVEGKTPLGDTVGKAPGTLAEARSVVEIILRLAIAKHHVAEAPGLVGHVNRHYCGSVIAEHHRGT